MAKMAKMAFDCLIFLLPLFLSCAEHVEADVNAHTVPKKGAYQHYAITGVHSGVNTMSGARPARRNILDLQRDSATLYAALLRTAS